jgi:phosphohistidine phosphatase
VRRLILFRHAKAAGRAVGQTDAERPLDARGCDDARLSGRWMAACGIVPDLVLISPSARTMQTWDCVEGFLPTSRIQVCDALYDAAPEDIEAALVEAGAGAGADTVLVIGHNPGLQELAVNLLSDGRARHEDLEKVASGFPTSTVAVLTIGQDGAAALEALFNPRRDTPPPFVESWDDDHGGAS